MGATIELEPVEIQAGAPLEDEDELAELERAVRQRPPSVFRTPADDMQPEDYYPPGQMPATAGETAIREDAPPPRPAVSVPSGASASSRPLGTAAALSAPRPSAPQGPEWSPDKPVAPEPGNKLASAGGVRQMQAQRQRAATRAGIVQAIATILGGARPNQGAIDAAGDRVTQRYAERLGEAERSEAGQRALAERAEALRQRQSESERQSRAEERAERSVDIQERGLERSISRQDAEERRSAAMHDPASALSVSEQALVRSARDGLGIQLPDETINGLSASQIRENPALSQMMRAAVSAQMASARRRPAGASGAGGGAGAARADAARAVIVRDLVSAGVSEDEAAARAAAMRPQDLSRVVSQATTAELSRGRERGERSEQAELPGWRRAEGSQPPSATVANEARKIASSDLLIRRLAHRLWQLSQQVSTMDAAQRRAGVADRAVAEAAELQANMTNQLRELAAMGTPTGNELALVNSRAPDLSSVQGLVNGRTIYEQLARVSRMVATAKMEMLGYGRAAAGGE